MGGKRSGRRAKRQSALESEVANGFVIPDENDAQPAEPTDTIPGTTERMEVYSERSAKGEPLFGDEDLKLFLRPIDLSMRAGEEHRPSRHGKASKNK